MKVQADFASSLEAISTAWRFADRHEFSRADELFVEQLQRSPSQYCLLEYSQFLFDCCSHDDAIDLLLNSVDESRAHLDFQSCCRLYNRLASFFRETRNVQFAMSYQQLAVSCSLEIDSDHRDFSIDHETLLGRAHDFLLAGELSEAESLLLSLRSRTGFLTAKANLLLGELYIQRADFEAALFVLEMTIDWARINEEPGLLLTALELESQASFEADDFETAKCSLDAAICLASQSGRCTRHLQRLQQQRQELHSRIGVRSFQPEWN